MTDNDKLNAAFKELDYEDEAFSELEKQLQRKVAHGVTDGSQHDPIAELEQENRLLRARNERLEAEQHLQALHDENVRLGLYEQNLNCKSVQARLATAWGYVKAEQGEPEGTVAELFDERVISKRELDRDLLVYIASLKENT